ncbi:vacuolar protein sorting-associated protein 9A-like isoform X1 [Punica granatum]|nr:vacuolar protein sorting-associated protein 9A-like isoform X1 [Punica granatum]OWM90194.1 hypothetical protein CDL15_Pgr006515 [Punica granatum]
METADVFLGLHDFLERMRQPSAADIVKSIKSFIVSFSNNAPDPERDSAAVQGFFNNIEATFRAHPLWTGCSEEDLESAGEGLEKYVMTKLYTHVFASAPDDVKIDEQLSEKMALVQQFVQPENLDIKPTFRNETSWLLAQKELQKINMCKAPRDKLVCILNCCKVINNLLHNAAIASDENPPGADEFLPVLIYVTIKANPPQLHSNLLYIQRYRRQSRLVAEAAYFFTNMLSAESFISNIDAKALSMDETEFEKNMESAQALLSGLSTDFDGFSVQTDESAAPVPCAEEEKPRHRPRNVNKGTVLPPKPPQTETRTEKAPVTNEQESILKVPSLSDLENKGADMLLKEDRTSKIFEEYPYFFAHAGDLTINEVEDLLTNYKQIVLKYICLSKGMGGPVSSPNSHKQAMDHAETVNEHVETVKEAVDTGKAEMNEESESSSAEQTADKPFPFEEGAFDFHSSRDEAVVLKSETAEETSQ